MVKSSYIPDRGDMVWLNFTSQSGHEHMGKHFALTISPVEYNKKSGLALFCPIASKEKGYPFEVKIHTEYISGFILADQIKSLDWYARKAQFIDKITNNEFDEVIEKIQVLIQ